MRYNSYRQKVLRIIKGAERYMIKKIKIKETQLKLQQEIVDELGINIVTCGDCGSVVLHEVCYKEIQCPDCGFTSDPCDFPDLNY